MSVTNVDQMLAQMRLLTAQARSESLRPEEPGGFAEMLKTSIGKVSEMQNRSNQMAEAFELGSDQYSLAEVMIAKQKAGIAFQSMVEVRKQLVDAYKTVMNMNI
jgi:flagellar hook-basal body complex protein FliE